jgi:hypothetical protein
MKRCLDDQGLVACHAGDGSEADHEHLESCLGCARKYRELQGDLATLISALRQPPLTSRAAAAATRTAAWPRGLRLALAASVVIAAFAGGRITGLTTPEAVIRPVAVRTAGGDQIAMADNVGAGSPAGYGLYIDDLIGFEGSDQDQQGADQDGGDNQVDEDSSAF